MMFSGSDEKSSVTGTIGVLACGTDVLIGYHDLKAGSGTVVRWKGFVSLTKASLAVSCR